jgi:glutathionyl-hydroquinone reductase
MGLLVNGKWVDEWYDTAATGGRFMRTRAQFRNWITADGSPGPRGRAVTGPRRDATTFMHRWPARGRIER